MNELPAVLVRWDRRRRGQYLLERAAGMAVTTLALGGLVALIARLVGYEALVVPALVTGAVLPCIGMPRWWARRDDHHTLAARVDAASSAQGLIMALAQADDPAWHAHAAPALRCAHPPAWDFRPLRLPLMLAFLAASVLLVPAPRPDPTAQDGTAFITPLRDDLAALATRDLLPPPALASLDERLQGLAEDARTGLDQATWAGLDQLAQDLATASDRAGQALADSLSTAEAAAAQAARLPELAAALAHLAQQAPGLVPPDLAGPEGAALATALAQAVQQGLLTTTQAEALRQRGLSPTSAATIDPATARAAAAALAKRLAESQRSLSTCRSGACRHGSCASCRAARACAACRGPGRAGHTDSGPGDTPPTYEDRARVTGGTTQALADGVRMNPDGSVTLATQSRSPEDDAAAAVALRRAADQHFAQAAADTRRAAIHPRHAGAVEAYFAAPDRPTPPPSIPPTRRPPVPAVDLPTLP